MLQKLAFKYPFINTVVKRPVHFPLAYIFIVSKILGFVAKGCPLLEYIDLEVATYWGNPLYAELIALASLRRLRYVFISMYFSLNSRKITPPDREDFRVSLYAIVGKGLLEV